MLGSRVLLNKQRRQAQKQNTVKSNEVTNWNITHELVSNFTPPVPIQHPNCLDLPLQMTFRQQEFDEDGYIRELIEEVESGQFQANQDQGIATYSIHELDALVDFTLNEYAVEQCLNTKINYELQKIWKSQVQTHSQTPQSNLTIRSLNPFKFKQIHNQNIDHEYSTLNFIKNSNQTTTQLIQCIENLSSQNQHLRQQSLNQQTQLIQRQTELHQLKDKYLSVLKEFTYFKQQTQQKNSVFASTIDLKQNQLIFLRQKQTIFEQTKNLLENQLQELKDSHSKQINELTQKLHNLYQLQLLQFIATINGLILDCQKPMVTLFQPKIMQQNQSNSIEFIEVKSEHSSEFLSTSFFKQTYKQKLSSISSQIYSFLEQKFSLDHQLISKQSFKINSLRQNLRLNHQFIKEINSLSEYELKVEKKDLTISFMDKSAENRGKLQQITRGQEGLELVEEITNLIKGHLLEQAKISRMVLENINFKDFQIIQLQNKINLLSQDVKQKEKQHFQGQPVKQVEPELFDSKKLEIHKDQQNCYSRLQSVSRKHCKSPIQMLINEGQSDKMSVNKSLLHLNQQYDYVQEFRTEDSQSAFDRLAESFEQKKKTFEPTKKSFELSNQTSSRIIDQSQEMYTLKKQNQALKHQLLTLKTELQNSIQTQQNKQNEAKSLTQTMGKIKKTSTKNSLNKLEPEISKHDNKQNIITQSNKMFQAPQHNQKCLNPQCKLNTKKLQTKINQYKQNIVNLNEIVNYFINHLKGYHFGNLNNRLKRTNFAKIYQTQNKTDSVCVVDQFGNTLPVRKYSYLEDQLQLASFREQKTQFNIRLNTSNSFNQTTKSTVISHNANPKQVGKITSVHQSVNNTHAHPTIKPHVNQQRIAQIKEKQQKIVSKETLRTNFQNFEFIRKLCLKQNKCKDLIVKFHSYLDFYLQKMAEIHLSIYDGQNRDQRQRNETIELQEMSNIWQDDEMSYFDSEICHNSSNYGIKARSLSSSHRISALND